MEGGVTVTGKSFAAKAQETLEASKVTAIKKTAFQRHILKIYRSAVLFTEILLSYHGLIARKYDTVTRCAADALLMTGQIVYHSASYFKLHVRWLCGSPRTI
ncbi:Uncharacterised protein [Raoultella terrigena]|uniref:Uncharacterized protein n=1 Tax=Raoultella terrigena TaxID=577 RepID=A0A3P8LZR0_RAOTE|nr:Uncharacterised protein [Raoultella terrigena]